MPSDLNASARAVSSLGKPWTVATPPQVCTLSEPLVVGPGQVADLHLALAGGDFPACPLELRAPAPRWTPPSNWPTRSWRTRATSSSSGPWRPHLRHSAHAGGGLRAILPNDSVGRAGRVPPPSLGRGRTAGRGCSPRCIRAGRPEPGCCGSGGDTGRGAAPQNAAAGAVAMAPSQPGCTECRTGPIGPGHRTQAVRRPLSRF
jgi:hypothetical protein